MHKIQKIFPTYECDYTDNFETQFKPLPDVIAYDAYFVDPQCDFDPYWDEEFSTKTSWSTKILTTNLLTRSNVMT